MSSITTSFYSATELIDFSSVQENYINLLRSNSSGNPSVLSVISGLLRQKHPFCLNSWISSALLLSSLCPILPVTHIQDVQLVSSPLEIERLMRQLESNRKSVSGSQSFGPFLLIFGKPRWVPLFISSYIHSEAQTIPFFSLTCDQGLMFSNQCEQNKSACVVVNRKKCGYFYSALFCDRLNKCYKMRFLTTDVLV